MESKDRVADLVGDLLGKSRHQSPCPRQAESKVQSQESPQSQQSPHSLTENDPDGTVTLDLTREEHRQEALPESAKARRFKVTLKSGGVLLHSAPSGLTRREAIELSRDWGEVAECVPACSGDRVPVPTQLEVRKPVSLALTQVRCADCAHFKRIDHPHTGRCAKGHGRHWLWDTDRRECADFKPCPQGRTHHEQVGNT